MRKCGSMHCRCFCAPCYDRIFLDICQECCQRVSHRVGRDAKVALKSSHSGKGVVEPSMIQPHVMDQNNFAVAWLKLQDAVYY